MRNALLGKAFIIIVRYAMVIVMRMHCLARRLSSLLMIRNGHIMRMHYLARRLSSLLDTRFQPMDPNMTLRMGGK